jgi:hypothetical protein
VSSAAAGLGGFFARGVFFTAPHRLGGSGTLRVAPVAPRLGILSALGFSSPLHESFIDESCSMSCVALHKL